MAPATKMPCKNNAKFMYSGKEMSPLGLGYAAEEEVPGTQMMGRDNKLWIVGVKNNVKIWLRIPEKSVLEKEEPLLGRQVSREDEGERKSVATHRVFKKIVKKSTEAVAEAVMEPVAEQTAVKRTFQRRVKELGMEEVPEKPKKSPTNYNRWIGSALQKLRKEKPGLEGMEYMGMAHALWKGMTKEEQTRAVEGL